MLEEIGTMVDMPYCENSYLIFVLLRVALGQGPFSIYFYRLFFFGFVGQIGFEYKFWFPLQLSADLRPTFGICDGEFWKDGLVYSFVPTFSVRYSF